MSVFGSCSVFQPPKSRLLLSSSSVSVLGSTAFLSTQSDSTRLETLDFIIMVTAFKQTGRLWGGVRAQSTNVVEALSVSVF